MTRTNFAAMTYTDLEAWYKDNVGYSPARNVHGVPEMTHGELATLCQEYEQEMIQDSRTMKSDITPAMLDASNYCEHHVGPDEDICGDCEDIVTFKSFRSIVFPQWARSLGFKDASWGNDACGKAEFVVRKETETRPGLYVRLWFNYANLDKRETGGERYYAELVTSDGLPLSEIYHGDDASDFAAMVRMYLTATA